MSTDQSTSANAAARSYYEGMVAELDAGASAIKGTKSRVSRSRGFVVVFWLIVFVLGWNGIVATGAAWGLAALGFVGLLFLAGWDEKLGAQIALANERIEVAKTQLARMDRDWSNVPACEMEAPEAISQTSADLDLFGHASLYQLICRAHTPRGREFLRDWISFGATPDVVARRNDAIAKLAPMREFRERFDLRGRMLGASQTGPAAFVKWAEGERWLESRSWLVLASRVLVAFGVFAFAVACSGFMTTAMLLTVAVVLLVNLLLSVVWAGKVHDIFEQVDSRQNDVVHYRELLDLFGTLPDEPELLAELRQRMGDDASRPQKAFSELSRIMQFARMRHSGVMGVVHLLLQLSFLIDFHLLGYLEKWHRKYGDNVRTWFDAVGELEALCSLASLVHDHPDWCLPNFDAGHDRFSATELGHPLIANPTCNDVELGPSGTFLLVTGSNMSGKSTLLRTIGLNCALAQAGAPTRAKSLQLPPVEVATSMRIQDSLEDGVSFFMAELRRLKQIVDQAEGMKVDSERTLLFLLDEILQGTNSAERHIAVTQVVRQLTDSRAMGAISTHDLELAKNDELNEISRAVHFRESITDADGMTFDYKMRSGVATTTNALKLLELVGIKAASTSH